MHTVQDWRFISAARCIRRWETEATLIEMLSFAVHKVCSFKCVLLENTHILNEALQNIYIYKR